MVACTVGTSYGCEGRAGGLIDCTFVGSGGIARGRLDGATTISFILGSGALRYSYNYAPASTSGYSGTTSIVSPCRDCSS